MLGIEYLYLNQFTMNIKEYNQKFQKIELRSAIVQSLVEKKEVIADLQATQFSKSQMKDGKSLPDYSPVSVAFYGKRPGPWTLRDTGAFYGAIQVIKIDSTGWEITSRDEKTPLIKAKLRNKFGSSGAVNLFGLNKESFEEFTNPHLRPELRRQMELQSGLKFGK